MKPIIRTDMLYLDENNRSPVIYDDNHIGCNFKVGHYVLIRQNNSIGDNVSIGSYTEVAYGCIIDDGVRIHSQCFICECSVLKRGCWIGPKVALINDDYPRTRNIKMAPTIDEYAIIGANSTIMPGIHIGKYALIGAGSVVTKDIPNGEVWVGNPAVFLKKRDDINAYSTL